MQSRDKDRLNFVAGMSAGRFKGNTVNHQSQNHVRSRCRTAHVVSINQWRLRREIEKDAEGHEEDQLKSEDLMGCLRSKNIGKLRDMKHSRPARGIQKSTEGMKGPNSKFGQPQGVPPEQRP